MLYLCRRGQSGAKREVFAFFPSVRRESMKKNVKSSIFRKKTSKFLSSLPFKRQTIDNQWGYNSASANKSAQYTSQFSRLHIPNGRGILHATDFRNDSDNHIMNESGSAHAARKHKIPERFHFHAKAVSLHR